MSVEELKQIDLCRVIGVRRAISPMSSVMRSTAALQISCYLLPVTVLEADKHIATLRDEEDDSKQYTECNYEADCLPWPESDVDIKSSGDNPNDRDRDAALMAKKERSFRASLTWDIWDECENEKFFLVPVYEVTQHQDSCYFDDSTHRCTHGLLLAQANNASAQGNQFRRRGCFEIRPGFDTTTFWRSAVGREPVDDIALVSQDAVAFPNLDSSLDDWKSYRGLIRRDGELQYQIELV
jgi:hypothetical protein